MQILWLDAGLPRDALLNKFADVREDAYVQTTSERMRIEVIGQRLLTGRMAIAEAALVFAKTYISGRVLSKGRVPDSRVSNVSFFVRAPGRTHPGPRIPSLSRDARADRRLTGTLFQHHGPAQRRTLSLSLSLAGCTTRRRRTRAPRRATASSARCRSSPCPRSATRGRPEPPLATDVLLFDSPLRNSQSAKLLQVFEESRVALDDTIAFCTRVERVRAAPTVVFQKEGFRWSFSNELPARRVGATGQRIAKRFEM